MTREEANTLRQTAHEIIIKLMNDGRHTSLKLLKTHCETALKEIAKGDV